MSDYLTEQEQIELLKKWIKEYSLVVILGILMAIAVISGWRFWQQRQNNRLAHASAIYNEMLNFRAQNDNKNTLVQAQKLFRHYSSTAYGEMAALMVAKETFMSNPQEAVNKLKWLRDNSNTPAFREIASIRLAKIFLEDKKPDQALDYLDPVYDKSFIGFINEVKGDVYLVKNQPALARAAYQDALVQIPNAQVSRPILQMKYDNLASST